MTPTMSDPISLTSQLMENRRLMKAAVSEARESGRDYAEKQAAYYAAKSKAALELKADGYAVTLIEMVVKGMPEVAGPLLEMQCAEALYKAALKAIDVYRDDSRIVYDQIKRAQMGDPGF